MAALHEDAGESLLGIDFTGGETSIFFPVLTKTGARLDKHFIGAQCCCDAISKSNIFDAKHKLNFVSRRQENKVV